ncbi:MAG: DUF4340 domain-containing protein, partial [bacterium]|nr:DUF4340 domain-containing protein [bacterium]
IGVFFLALVAYVYFYEIMGEEKRQEEEKIKDLIYLFEFNDVEKVDVIRGDSSFSCVRIEDNWQLTSPVNYKAHNTAVGSIINLFKNAKNENMVSETGEDLDGYGLGDRAPRMKLTFNDGSVKTLIVGENNPTDSHIYAKLEDSPEIFMTTASLHSKLREPLKNFRHRKILDVQRTAVDRMIINENGQEIVVKKRDPASVEWILEKPIETKADDARVGILLDKIFSRDIVAFADDNPSDLGKYGLDNPRATLEIYSGDGSAGKKISFGNPVKDRVYLMIDDKNAVFEMDSSDINMMTQGLYSLREKRITSFVKSRIDAMEISLPDQMYVFAKEDTSDQWYMESPERKRAKKFKIDGMIDEFFWIKAKVFVEEKGVSRDEYGLNPPEADVILKSEGTEILRIQIGKQLNDRLNYFFSVTRNQLYLIDKNSKDRMIVPIDEMLEEKN